jgi:hypothetical protein
MKLSSELSKLNKLDVNAEDSHKIIGNVYIIDRGHNGAFTKKERAVIKAHLIKSNLI